MTIVVSYLLLFITILKLNEKDTVNKFKNPALSKHIITHLK